VVPPTNDTSDVHIPLGGSAAKQLHDQKRDDKDSPLPSPDDSSRGSSPLVGLRGPQFVCEVRDKAKNWQIIRI